jgi:hypothetical protein
MLKIRESEVRAPFLLLDITRRKKATFLFKLRIPGPSSGL